MSLRRALASISAMRGFFAPASSSTSRTLPASCSMAAATALMPAIHWFSLLMGVGLGGLGAGEGPVGLQPLVCCCLSGWRDQSRIWPVLGTDRGRPRPAPHHGAYQESIGLVLQDRRSLQASATVSPDKPIYPSLEVLTWQC